MLTDTTANTQRVFATLNINSDVNSLFAELAACPMSELVPKIVELSATMTGSQWSALQNVAEESAICSKQAARVEAAMRHIGLLTY